MKFKNKKIVFLLALLVFLGAAYSAFAYELIVPIPGPGNPGGKTDISSPTEYVKNIYTFGLGFGALLAILMIVIGGIQYTVSESVGKKEDAKSRIESALLGLGLLLAAFIILRTINPDLDIQTLRDPGTSPPVCGNNIIEAGEDCEGSARGQVSATCPASYTTKDPNTGKLLTVGFCNNQCICEKRNF